MTFLILTKFFVLDKYYFLQDDFEFVLDKKYFIWVDGLGMCVLSTFKIAKY